MAAGDRARRMGSDRSLSTMRLLLDAHISDGSRITVSAGLIDCWQLDPTLIRANLFAALPGILFHPEGAAARTPAL